MTREHSGTVPSPAPSCQLDTAKDGATGPLATERLCSHLRRSKREVRRSMQLM